jgi:hypothetical protein
MTFQFGDGNVSLSVCVAAERVPCGFQTGSMIWTAAVVVDGDGDGDVDGGGSGDGSDGNNENNEKR